MKFTKISALLLALIMIFVFGGCANGDESSDLSSVESYDHGVNILAYAEKGEIPELPFEVGHDVQDIKDTFMNYVESGSEIEELGIVEGEKTVWLEGGSMMFCYEKAKEENGVSVIVAQEYAYEFGMGIYAPDDIIEAVGSEDYTRAETTDEDAFFLPVTPTNSECIAYSAGDYVLRFIFVEGYLSAVTLTDPANWG